eukprot:COSAG02_NODE_35289_length_471_cov_0.637097_1_plen_54_part_10
MKGGAWHTQVRAYGSEKGAKAAFAPFSQLGTSIDSGTVVKIGLNLNKMAPLLRS